MSRICDFCQAAGNGFAPAITSVVIGEIETYDACGACVAIIKELLSQQKEEKSRGPGRPRKIVENT